MTTFVALSVVFLFALSLWLLGKLNERRRRRERLETLARELRPVVVRFGVEAREFERALIRVGRALAALTPSVVALGAALNSAAIAAAAAEKERQRAIRERGGSS